MVSKAKILEIIVLSSGHRPHPTDQPVVFSNGCELKQMVVAIGKDEALKLRVGSFLCYGTLLETFTYFLQNSRENLKIENPLAGTYNIFRVHKSAGHLVESS